MKIEELKHNHSLTDLLKILLFTILMLAPIGMVATRCLYVIANKNAYQSYTGYDNTDRQYVNIDNYSLEPGATYRCITNNDTTGITVNESGRINCENIHFDSYTISTTTAENIQNNCNQFEFWVGSSGNISMRFIMSTNLTYSLSSTVLNFTFDFIGYYNVDQTNDFSYYFGSMIYKPMVLNQSNNLDNVFEYSVSQLEESNLFNWTENTAIFSGINAMNVQLGINSPAITIVLTYWLILTCIYVIIDIVLKLFTYLTHMIGSRKT